MRFKTLFILMLWLSLMVINGHSDITSPDNTFVANDQYSSDFHTRLNRDITQLTNGVNNIVDGQLRVDTLLERSMADEINPRVRTYEGAACEFVYTGLLPATDSDLTSDISSGTAYPRGFRVNKTSATSHTYTASRWTFVDIDQNGDFQFSEVTIDAATPAIATNSIRLARVSTDATTVAGILDLRSTSCSDGPFENIKDNESSGADLEDLFSIGAFVRRGGTPGFISGLHISHDSTSTFRVTSGAAYIGGRYRFSSNDITVPQTTDAPSTGVSGLDTGAIAASTHYNIFAVADQENTASFSITYVAGSTPSGVTYYRKIGEITTSADNSFVARNLLNTTGNINQREIVAAWINFDGTGTIAIKDAHNVSSITDNGTGAYTVTFDNDFANTGYATVCTSRHSGAAQDSVCSIDNSVAPTVGAIKVNTMNDANVNTDSPNVNLVVFGDIR